MIRFLSFFLLSFSLMHQEAFALCSTMSVTGTAGTDATIPPTSFITAIVANNSNTLTVFSRPVAGGTSFGSTIGLGNASGLIATGSFGNANSTAHITSISGSGNVIVINGVPSITITGGTNPIFIGSASSTGSVLTSGLTKMSGLANGDGFSYRLFDGASNNYSGFLQNATNHCAQTFSASGALEAMSVIAAPEATQAIFKLDNTIIDTDSSVPFSTSFGTKELAPGVHFAEVIVSYAGAGQIAQSKTIMVDNSLISTSSGTHTCTCVDQSAMCWGLNIIGQLGYSAPIGYSAFPGFVTNMLAKSLQPTVGGNHSCARFLSDAYCWGNDSSGQLGNGAGVNSSQTPTLVTGLSANPLNLAAGSNHTCALLKNGQVQCWGINSSGQLGNNTTINSQIPVTVVTTINGITSPLTDVVGLTSKADHTCAIKRSGTNSFVGVCWGLNSNGQLGNSTTVNSSKAVLISNQGTFVTKISAGVSHTCALMVVSGATKVRCWGSRANGAIGSGSTVGNALTPVTVVTTGGKPKDVAAGGNHSCARLGTNQLQCWGKNNNGQLGIGNTVDQLIPANVILAPSTFAGQALNAGNGYTCTMLNTSSDYFCWGVNDFGQLGNGTFVNSSLPTAVFGL